MKYDIAYYELGNGITVCNRAVKNCTKVAHISETGVITWYLKRIPKAVVEEIEECAALYVPHPEH